jgi:FkbM family methyltransferase
MADQQTVQPVDSLVPELPTPTPAPEPQPEEPPFPPIDPDLLRAQSAHVDCLQIGAHIGHYKDDALFYMSTTSRTMVLVEPVPYAFKTLVKHCEEYKQDHKILCMNVAVSNYDGTLRLYIPGVKNDFSKYPPWATELASANPTHISSILPDLVTEVIDVKCTRLNTLIQDLGIKRIEYLMVDTEGHDYDILMDLDLSILKPKKIRFENKHMDGVHVRGEKYEKLLKHYELRGYTKTDENDEDTVLTLNVDA